MRWRRIPNHRKRGGLTPEAEEQRPFVKTKPVFYEELFPDIRAAWDDHDEHCESLRWLWAGCPWHRRFSRRRSPAGRLRLPDRSLSAASTSPGRMIMPFRVGGNVGFTVYWSDPTGRKEDRFVATAMSREMAEDIADALNDVHATDTAVPPDPVRTVPIVPRRSQDG